MRALGARMTFPVVHPQAKESRPYDICNYSILVGWFLDVPITIINFQLSTFSKTLEALRTQWFF